MVLARKQIVVAMKRYLFQTLSVILFFLVPSAAFGQGTTAEYMVVFESTWSASTHPSGFPSNPHFSGLIGATHDSTITLWAPGELASEGIENMAETGSKFPLTTDIDNAIEFGGAEHLLSGGGISVSPGSRTLMFSVSDQYPLVSLVSMLAPSPDWFVGVHDFNLFEQGSWIEEVTVDLFVYDAGTDSGPDYTSSDEDTQPAENIFRIENSPFLINDAVDPVGTFTFRLLSSVNTERVESTVNTLYLDPPYPNPFSTETAFTVQVPVTEEVEINIYDILGRKVRAIHKGVLAAGASHVFSFEGVNLPNGHYIATASTSTAKVSRMILLLR